MKVAGIKGIRVIMGAAKDERGSVFRNTKFYKALGLLIQKAGINGTLC